MNTTRRHRPMPKEVHHGRTPAAWAGAMLALAGMIVICAGMLMGNQGFPSINMPVLGLGVVLLVVAPLVGGIMNRVGMGQD